jgi:hypothetical protein
MAEDDADVVVPVPDTDVEDRLKLGIPPPPPPPPPPPAPGVTSGVRDSGRISGEAQGPVFGEAIFNPIIPDACMLGVGLSWVAVAVEILGGRRSSMDELAGFGVVVESLFKLLSNLSNFEDGSFAEASRELYNLFASKRISPSSVICAMPTPDRCTNCVYL